MHRLATFSRRFIANLINLLHLFTHSSSIPQAIGTAYLGEEIDRLAESSRNHGDIETQGNCTPPALSSTQSVDTLSIALFKALSDFTASTEEGGETQEQQAAKALDAAADGGGVRVSRPESLGPRIEGDK